MIEGSEEKQPNQRVSYNGLYDKNKIAIMQKLARNFGVTIQTLAEEGEQYSNQSGTYTGKVPEGQSYIRFGRKKSAKLHGFWNAVLDKQKKLNNHPRKSPKI